MSDAASARARSQRLLDERLTDVFAAVLESAGIQAQDQTAAALSIRVRTSGLDRAAVESALARERSIVRLWAMRGTIHLVPSEDARWLVDLLGPLSLTASHRRLTQLGVPEADRPRALAAICTALAEHGPLTRSELMEHVARAGIRTEGQAGAHLPQLAALRGLVCFGPPRRGKPTYALRDDWLGPDLPQLPRERALSELARRYVRAFGPAAPQDFASWSGLPLRDAQAGWQAIARELIEVEHGWVPAGWVDETPPYPPVMRLLPAFDTYLLGYRMRDTMVPREHARRVWPGGGIVRPTVVANGRCAGTWRRAGTRVEIEPFPGSWLAVDDEIADVRRFLS
ncbi:MAG: hypothetical protein QOC77_2696 [Thermoleophilaceae bacterium]|nr:hypothetical protein [Thermoleophilaceae bacterium]